MKARGRQCTCNLTSRVLDSPPFVNGFRRLRVSCSSGVLIRRETKSAGGSEESVDAGPGVFECQFSKHLPPSINEACLVFLGSQINADKEFKLIITSVSPFVFVPRPAVTNVAPVLALFVLKAQTPHETFRHEPHRQGNKSNTGVRDAGDQLALLTSGRVGCRIIGDLREAYRGSVERKTGLRLPDLCR